MPMNLWLLLVVLAQDKADEARLHGSQMQQQQAQLIVLREQNLIDAGLGRQLALAIPEAGAETRRGVAPLREDYAAFESRLVAKVGERASLLHLGRSNNGMGATINPDATRTALSAR